MLDRGGLADRFEGWSGIAHGGILATLLDEVMAWSLIGEESWGLTARLSIEFHRPVPIGRRLRAEGQVERSRRRLVQTSARILDATSGEVYATGTATYVAADPARRRDLQARYGFRFLEDRASSESSDAEVGASPSGAEVRA